MLLARAHSLSFIQGRLLRIHVRYQLLPSSRTVSTLYSDWYSGALPYKVTPLQGISQRLGAGATVLGSEGVDRIALKDVATGRYVTGGSGPGGAVLAESATTADATTQFDAF